MERIVYFDGHCNLCNRAVDFLIRHDSNRRLKYASLQGQTAAARLPLALRTDIDSLVYEDQGQHFIRSTAALRSLAALGGIFRLVSILLLIPPFMRDALYRFVAHNRYQWFGRRESCRIPTEAERQQILP